MEVTDSSYQRSQIVGFKHRAIRGTFKSKAPLRVQFLPALGGEGVGKG